MGVAESIKLVHDKQAEDHERGWVIPETHSQKPNHQPQLDNPVGQKVNGREVPGTDREMVCGVAEVIGDQVARVLVQLPLCNRVGYLHEPLPADEKGNNAANNLGSCENRLEPETDPEYDPDIPLIKEFPGKAHA